MFYNHSKLFFTRLITVTKTIFLIKKIFDFQIKKKKLIKNYPCLKIRNC